MASKDGRPIASILTLSFKKTMVYKYGGSDAAHHPLGGMPFLFWRAIQEAKAQGIEELDLGRSDLDQPGLIAFKDHLGATRSDIDLLHLPGEPQTPRRTTARSPAPPDGSWRTCRMRRSTSPAGCSTSTLAEAVDASSLDTPPTGTDDWRCRQPDRTGTRSRSSSSCSRRPWEPARPGRTYRVVLSSERSPSGSRNGPRSSCTARRRIASIATPRIVVKGRRALLDGRMGRGCPFRSIGGAAAL